MLFSLYTIISTILVALVAAQYPNSFSVPPSGYSFKAGHTVNLTWTILAGDTVTLKLRPGVSMALDAGTTIVAGLKNTGSYLWAIPSDTVKGEAYAIEIVDDDNTNIINYTPQFPIDSNVLSSVAASTTGTISTSNTISTAATITTISASRTTRINSTISTKGVHNSTAAASTTIYPSATSTSTDQTGSTSASAGAAAQLVKPALCGTFLAVFALVLGL
ncbi:MAG: hypothetical protein GOMPHAMPRED_002506 [Gomphillus americanus]|uniref:Yeast cell wall synthesis Kre9/Knh1-like N-terminal domain-containing protein n=1 Tax=Gomphillus americanus TaxID=1940652 RepID=A0A8H3IIM5_9LECA|nr:MAG: hypothetical protein GOMPHAMPRED_002506 [Gomphillus americanus]